MQLIEKENEHSSNKTDMLKNMKVSKNVALEVSIKDTPVVRSLISKLHRETEMRFETKKTPTGINAWRIK